jgi:transcriptional regulator with XRE-family HTH domain
MSCKTQLLNDHFDTLRLSQSELVDKYGMSLSTVQKWIREAKRDGREYTAVRKRRVDPRSVEARRPISRLHSYIGLRVLRYRTEHDLKVTEMGPKIKLSRAKIGPLEAGSYDLTLGDIQRIATLIGEPLESLLNLPEAHKT